MPNAKKVMILSGAGLSAESGLKTFRDGNGLWEEHDVMEVCSASGFARNPTKVREFYNERRAQLAKVQPNHAHKVIAELKAHYKDDLFVVTQNVDDLLERAGCAGVVHLHGFLPELYCSACGFVQNVGYDAQKNTLCPKCKQPFLRHNIVMFEEAAPQYSTLYELLGLTKLFIAIGTSGYVLPVGHFARSCEQSILNNLIIESELGAYFDKVYEMKASEAIDKIAVDIAEFLGV